MAFPVPSNHRREDPTASVHKEKTEGRGVSNLPSIAQLTTQAIYAPRAEATQHTFTCNRTRIKEKMDTTFVQ